MRASAQAHLELKDGPAHRWQWYWHEGVRYVALTSANSGKVHRVRADSQGCDCDAYLVWQYSACSHMLAVRESLNHEALAAWVDDRECEQAVPEGWTPTPTDELEAVAAFEARIRSEPDRPKLIRTYEEVYGLGEAF